MDDMYGSCARADVGYAIITSEQSWMAPRADDDMDTPPTRIKRVANGLRASYAAARRASRRLPHIAGLDAGHDVGQRRLATNRWRLFTAGSARFLAAAAGNL